MSRGRRGYRRRAQLIAFNFDTAEPACGICSGIDIDAVRAQVRLHDGRVTMNDEFVERCCAKQEVISDPQQILIILFRDWYARPKSGMNEKEVAACEGSRHVPQE